MRIAKLRKLLVLSLDESRGEIAVRPIPEWINAQDLDVDALFIHLAQSIGADEQRNIRGWSLAHHFHDARDRAMRVNVDDLDAPSTNRDLTPADLGVWNIAKPAIAPAVS